MKYIQILFFVCLTTTIAFAQTEKNTDQTNKNDRNDHTTTVPETGTQDNQSFMRNSEELSRDLSTQLSLTPEQTSEINRALVQYQSDMKNAGTNSELQTRARNRANESLDRVFQNNQRTQWDSMRERWWNNTNNRLNRNNQNDGKMQNDMQNNRQNANQQNNDRK